MHLENGVVNNSLHYLAISSPSGASSCALCFPNVHYFPSFFYEPKIVEEL
jgi:hypothetical protein